MRYFLRAVTAAAILGAALPCPSRGQFLGETSPQTVNQQIFSAVNTTQVSPSSNANQSLCNTIPISTSACAISNLGQSIHYVTVRSSAGRSFRLTLEGTNDGTNWFAMGESGSDPGIDAGAPGFGGFTASGSFTAYRLNLQVGSGSGTMSVWYSGTSVSYGLPGGNFNPSVPYRRILALAPNSSSGLTLSAITKIVYPAGNTSATVYWQYQANPCGTGSLSIASGPDGQHLTVIATIIPANNTGLQTFVLPAFLAGAMSFSYTTCGTETYDTFVEFSSQAGADILSRGTFTHVVGTTATVAKGTAGFLHTLSINTGGAGTVSIFDLATAACTGTPATNVIAVITAVATTLQTFTYDVNAVNGICVKASVAMDFTVSTN